MGKTTNTPELLCMGFRVRGTWVQILPASLLALGPRVYFLTY